MYRKTRTVNTWTANNVYIKEMRRASVDAVDCENGALVLAENRVLKSAL
jgi:hypothetical protein